MGILKLKEEYIRLTSSKRLYKLDKPIIGLTGGIATGKSTASQILSDKGFSIIDADRLVKSIYEKEESIRFIENINENLVQDQVINFKALRTLFFNDSKVKKSIEGYIYSKLEESFLKECEKIQQQDFIIYDVPLLFEKKLEGLVDISTLVYCSQETQVIRLMQRDSSSEEEARRIISHQLSIEEKKKKSDYVIDNSGTKGDLQKNIKSFVDLVTHY